MLTGIPKYLKFGANTADLSEEEPRPDDGDVIATGYDIFGIGLFQVCMPTETLCVFPFAGHYICIAFEKCLPLLANNK